MRLYKVVVLINVALGLGLLSGFLWWGREAARLGQELASVRQKTETRQASARSWTLKGIVRGVAPELNVIFITHEEIPGLMAGMTMGFRASSPKLLQGLTPGDTIQFTLNEANNEVLVVAVLKVGRLEGTPAQYSLSAQMLDVLAVGHGTGGPVLAIPAEYAKRLLDEGDRPIFIDLRPVEEFRKGRLPRARSLPISELRRRFAEVPRTGRVILYCACPPEEIQAGYQYLRDQGYRNLSVMEEGFPGWVKRGYPVER